MPIPKNWLLAIFIIVGVTSGVAQDDITNAGGAGVSFGYAVARTDITAATNTPFTRAFLRYYAASNVAFEVGVGMGTLKADDGVQFFNSPIYPVDGRCLFSYLKKKSLSLCFCRSGIDLFQSQRSK